MSQQSNRLDDLLARNMYVHTLSSHQMILNPPIQRKYQQTYTPPPSLAAIKASLPPSPVGITIVSCADPRVIPENFMGFSVGGTSPSHTLANISLKATGQNAR